MIRTKIIEMDGVKLTIGGLTLEQVEEFVQPIVGADSDKRITKRTLDLVCWSLNNALADGQPKWTHDRIRKEMDLPLFEKLQSEIIPFSGLKITRRGAAGQGEEQAPSGKVTLTISDGASLPQPDGRSNTSIV